MANAFASLGHDVALYVSTRKTAIAESPEAYYGVPFRFMLKWVSIPDIVGSIHRFPKILHPYLYILERIFFSISFILTMWNKSYDLIYCRDDLVLWCVALFFPRQKVVWESHEGKHNFFSKRLLSQGLTVVISEGIKERYVSLGHNPELIFVAHDAVDDSFFSAPADRAQVRMRLGIASEKPVVLYIGGLDAWKGVYTLFDAAVLLPHVHMAVIGGADTKIASLRIEYPSVQFLGSRPYRELPENQQAADILVIPNTAKDVLSSSYTSPLKLFAHMTSRVPLIVSDIPSLRAVLDEASALFFEPDNPRSLAEGISQVLHNPEEAHTRALHAYELSKRYTWKERARVILLAEQERSL